MAEVKKTFKDFYQYTKKQFEDITPQAGNFYLVREVELDENGNEKVDESGNKIPTGNAEIWFGTRKYADVGNISCGTF